MQNAADRWICGAFRSSRLDDAALAGQCLALSRSGGALGFIVLPKCGGLTRYRQQKVVASTQYHLGISRGLNRVLVTRWRCNFCNVAVAFLR